MATVTTERKVLIVEGKSKVMRQIENGKKKTDKCWEFGLVNSTIQKMCKNRTKMCNAFEENRWRIKRFQEPERSNVDEALRTLLKQK